MAFADPGKEIQTRVQQLTSAINLSLKAHYAGTKTKAADQISVSISHGPGGKVRTPAQQAASLLSGRSWTANSSHMADGAKHVLMRVGGKVTWDLNGLAKNQKAAWAVLEKQWNDSMKLRDLRNYTRGKGFAFPSSDPLHLELPDSRLKNTDPRVIKVLQIYAKATRLQGKAKNLPYENKKGSTFQKNWLKNYDKQLAAKKGAKGAKAAKGAIGAPPIVRP